MSGAGFKCFTVCLLYWGLKQCNIYLQALKWAKDLLGFLALIDFKSSNLGDPNWFEKSVGSPMAGGG